jgi:hypothetical protein
MAVPVMRLMAQTGKTAADPAPTTETEVLVEEIAATGAGIAPEPAPEPEAQPSPTPTPTPEPALPAPVFAPSSPEVKEAPPVQSLAPARPEPNEPLVTIAGRAPARANYGPEGDRRAAQLRSFPPETFTFDRASLRDVLRFLAEQAGIPYIGIPEHSPKAQRLVTFRMTASPFVALESVARQNDIRLSYDDGVWFMGLRDANLERVRKAEDDNELIGVIYQLRYDPVDVVDFKGGGGGGVSGGPRASGGGTTSTPQLPLQYSQRVFEAKAPDNKTVG